MMSDDSEWDACFIWRIEQFSAFFSKAEDELFSPDFEVKCLNHRKWRLIIDPESNPNADVEYVSCYLSQLRENERDQECVIDYKITLMNEKSDILESKTSKNQIFRREYDDWGWKFFIEKDRLLAEMKKCTEDTLIICCHIQNKEERKLVKNHAQTRMNAEKYFFEWNIEILPNGMLHTGKRFFCLKDNLYRMSLSTNDNDLMINICKITEAVLLSRPITRKIGLLDSKGIEVFTKTESHTYDTKCVNKTWKFPLLITKKQLLDYISNDAIGQNIIILCEFSINKEIEKGVTMNSKSISNIDGLLNLSEDLRYSLANISNSDVQLQVQEGDKLQAHRSILAARSPVFSAMLDQEMLVSQTGLIDIKDVDSSTLKSFLEFLYTGIVHDLDYEKASKLLMVADKYHVPSLKKICYSFLKYTLCVGNVCDLLVLSDMINHEHLKLLCIHYICENSKEVFPSMIWSELVEKNWKLSVEVIEYIGENCKITPKNS